MEKILVIDFGSQYTQLIARRLRELSVYSEVCPWDEIPDLSAVKGFILSGGPESSNIEGNPSIHQQIFDSKKPILGFSPIIFLTCPLIIPSPLVFILFSLPVWNSI